MEPSQQPEYPQDSPAATLADECGLTLLQAQSVLAYLAQNPVTPSDTADALRKLFAYIAGAPNFTLRFHAVCLGLGLMLGDTDKSLTAIADKIGVTRQRVSQELIEFLDTFHLGKCPHNKKTEARKTYEQYQRLNHWTKTRKHSDALNNVAGKLTN